MPVWFPIAMGLLAILSFVCAAWTFDKVRKMRAEAARSKAWPTVDGILTASYIGTIQKDAGEAGSVDVEVACVRYGYRVGGKDYQSDRIGAGGYLEGKRKVLDDFIARHPVGGSVPVYHDPQDPTKAVLAPGEAGGPAGQYLFAAVMLMIVGVLTICATVYVALSS